MGTQPIKNTWSHGNGLRQPSDVTRRRIIEMSNHEKNEARACFTDNRLRLLQKIEFTFFSSFFVYIKRLKRDIDAENKLNCKIAAN